MYTHRYLNIYKVSLHVAMSMLSYLATALAHLKADDYVHMRHMRIRLPQAGKRLREKKPDPTIIAALLMHQFNELQRAA